MATLRSRAGVLELILDARSYWTPVFTHRVKATQAAIPFPAATTAWMTIRDEYGGTVLLRLGPAGGTGPDGEALDGTLVVDAGAGTITGTTLASSLLSAALDALTEASPGVFDLVIYPAGEEEEQYPLLKGVTWLDPAVIDQPLGGS